MPDPTFLTLDQWGGTPNGWPQMTLPAVALWAHHSVTNEDLGVFATANAIADFLELDAIGKSRGHGGISYSYAIHPEGVIGEGQGKRRGAHTAGNGCNGSPWGWNPCSFGVVFIGNYDDDTLTDAAINSFRWLRDVLIANGDLVAGVYPTGGHQDAPGNATGCPGHNIETNLDLLRAPYAPIPGRDRMNPQLFQDPADTSGAVYLYDPNAHTKVWVQGPDALAAIQAAWSVASPPVDATIVSNETAGRILRDAVDLRAGGGVTSAGGALNVTLTGTATPA